ncbi:MAG TPA: hypothetical protein VIN67_10465, partial [Desulfobaccales bacterium]
KMDLPSSAWRVTRPQARLGNEKETTNHRARRLPLSAFIGGSFRSQPFFLCWIFLPGGINKREGETLRRLSLKSEGDCLCSATAAALRRIFPEIKGLAAQTPPAQSGTIAAQFA